MGQADLERGLVPLRIVLSVLMLIILFIADAGADTPGSTRAVFAVASIANVLLNARRFVGKNYRGGSKLLAGQIVLDGILGIAAVLILDPVVTPLAWIALLVPVLDAIALHSNTAGLLTWVAVSAGYLTFRSLYPSLGGELAASFSTGLQQLLAAALVGLPIGFWSTRLADSLRRANDERRLARHTATRLRASAQAGRRLVALPDPASVERDLIEELMALGVDRAELWRHVEGAWRLQRAKGQPLEQQTDVLLDRAVESQTMATLRTDNQEELQEAHLTGFDFVVAVPLHRRDDGVLRVWSSETSRLGPAEQEAINVLAASGSTSLENARVHKALEDWSNELEFRANHDPLTGLLNRSGLFAAIETLTNAQQPDELGVIFLDLDGFKEVNDTLGHEAGDRVLQVIAKRFEKALPDGALLARMGGDEMAVVFSAQNDLDAMTTFAERLVATASESIRIEPHTAQVGASVGLTRAPGSVGIDVLMAEADTAMYQAKRAGGGAVAFADAN